VQELVVLEMGAPETAMTSQPRSAAQQRLCERLGAAERALRAAATPYREVLDICNKLLSSLHETEMPEIL
jgi:hypothetical protein